MAGEVVPFVFYLTIFAAKVASYLKGSRRYNLRINYIRQWRCPHTCITRYIHYEFKENYSCRPI